MSAPFQPEGTPGYWMHETSGVLAPVVKAYLNGELLTVIDIGVMRAYLRQWIMAPGFIGEGTEALRRSVEQIQTQRDIDEWIEAAIEEGIDPL